MAEPIKRKVVRKVKEIKPRTGDMAEDIKYNQVGEAIRKAKKANFDDSSLNANVRDKIRKVENPTKYYANELNYKARVQRFNTNEELKNSGKGGMKKFNKYE